MIMQAGFCLFETGLVRSKNSINVAFKNVSDFTIAAITYWLIGYALMYGDSLGGFIGTSGFAYSHGHGNGAWFVYQLMFCCAAATIVGGATAMKFSDAETPTHRLQATRPVSLRFRIRQILVATGWISILFAIDGGNLRLVSFAASFAFGMSILWGVAYCRTACNFLEN